MSAMAPQIRGVSIVCLGVCSDTDKGKHRSSASLAFVRRIHRWPVDFPHKGSVTRKMFSFDDVMICLGVWACPVQYIIWTQFESFRDHFVNAPSQWKTTLHCNVVSHWSGAYTKWSMCFYSSCINLVNLLMMCCLRTCIFCIYVFLNDLLMMRCFWQRRSSSMNALSVCPSVRLSVYLSVRQTFFTIFLSLYHHKIVTGNYHWQKFLSIQKAKVRGQKATGCICGVWCRGLTACITVVS